MFKLGTIKISRSFEDFQFKKNLITTNKFHNSQPLAAKSTAEWNHFKINNWNDSIFNDKIKFINTGADTRKDIGKLISEAKDAQVIKQELVAKKNLIKSCNTFKKALEHDCFYDEINQNGDTVTIAFLPISTSAYPIFCGIQKFHKIHINPNIKGFKNIYITRVLFHKTMTRVELEEWETKYRYQDKKFRKAIFNEIQKDLENNSYSLLKESDLLEPNVEFFSKELPLVKFKFTDLED